MVNRGKSYKNSSIIGIKEHILGLVIIVSLKPLEITVPEKPWLQKPCFSYWRMNRR